MKTHLQQSLAVLLRLSLILILGSALPVGADEIRYPTASSFLTSAKSIINVKDAPYNAVGNGSTDDTVAVQSAINDAIGKKMIVYLPAGTYRITDTLKWQKANGVWAGGTTLMGESKASVTIQLPNSQSGFGNAASPKAMVMTGSSGGASDGHGYNAFHNNVLNLTISVGSGNAGAVGVDYLANNVGSMRDVEIRSEDGSGHAGILMSRSWPGPCFIKNVTIDGFDYAVWARHLQYSVTFEHLTLLNQNTAGIHNRGNVLTIRNLISSNTVPAIDDINQSFTTLIDSNLTGGANTNHAIVSSASANLILRNVQTSGYLAAVFDGGVSNGSSEVDEYRSLPEESLFTSPPVTLELPIEETPTHYESDLSKWVNVEDFGAFGTLYPSGGLQDYVPDTAAIQAAIDSSITSGATTLYFPRGSYLLEDTVIVRGNIRRIVGMNSFIRCRSNSTFSNLTHGKPMFSFESTVPVIVENLNFAGAVSGGNADGAIPIVHSPPSP